MTPISRIHALKSAHYKGGRRGPRPSVAILDGCRLCVSVTDLRVSVTDLSASVAVVLCALCDSYTITFTPSSSSFGYRWSTFSRVTI
jgi:hypothetical protein